MVTERELLQAIEECESGQMTPPKLNRLADLCIVYEHLFGYDEPLPMYRELPTHDTQKATEKGLTTNRSTEFLKLIDGKEAEKVLGILDELVEAVKVLHPRMYDSLLRKLTEI